MSGAAGAAGPRSVCRRQELFASRCHARSRARRGALRVRADASPQNAVELSTVRSVNDIPAADWCVS